MKNEKVMTIEKFLLYVKKYWWILAISFLLGVAGMLFSMSNNSIQQKQEKIYTQDFLPEIIDNEKMVSISYVAGNCKVLLNLPDIQEEINSILEQSGNDPITTWSKVEVDNVENSNFFSVTITQDKENAEKQIQVITDVLNENLLRYDQNISITRVGDLQEFMQITSSGQRIYLKDVLVLFGFVCLGLFIIYMIALFGNLVVDLNELRALFGEEEKLCIKNKKNIWMFSQWINSLDSNKNTHFIMGKGTEQFSELINSYRDSNFQTESLDKYREVINNIKKDNVFYVIRRMDTNISDLENVIKINEMYQVKIDGWVYIKI